MKPHDWEELCRVHGPMVWATVFRLLNDHAAALDCYQEVFLEAFQKTRGRKVDDWPSLLRWYSVHRSIDHLRQRKRAALLGTAAGDSVERIACHDLTSHDAQLNELMGRLREELAKLPVRQATAFWIRCVEERSYAEIAEQMKTKPNEVGVLIHRARQQLRESLSDLKPSPFNKE